MSQVIITDTTPYTPVKESPLSSASSNKSSGEKGRPRRLKELSTNLRQNSAKKKTASMVESQTIKTSASEDTQGSNGGASATSGGTNENKNASSKSKARNLRRKRAIQRKKDSSSNGNPQEVKTVTPEPTPLPLATASEITNKNNSNGQSDRNNKKKRKPAKRNSKGTTEIEKKAAPAPGSTSTKRVENVEQPVQVKSPTIDVSRETAVTEKEDPALPQHSRVVAVNEETPVVLAEPPKADAASIVKPAVVDLTTAYHDDNKDAAKDEREDCACNACAIS